MKRCVICKKDFPNTAEFFHKHNFYADRFTIICKHCKNKQDRERYKKNKEKEREGKEKKEPERTDRMPIKMKMKRPPQALDLNKIQAKKYKEGKVYEVKWKPKGQGNGSESQYFKGKLIQETKDHITLENKRGIRQSFLKVDFYIDKRIQELS